MTSLDLCTLATIGGIGAATTLLLGRFLSPFFGTSPHVQVTIGGTIAGFAIAGLLGPGGRERTLVETIDRAALTLAVGQYAVHYIMTPIAALSVQFTHSHAIPAFACTALFFGYFSLLLGRIAALILAAPAGSEQIAFKLAAICAGHTLVGAIVRTSIIGRFGVRSIGFGMALVMLACSAAVSGFAPPSRSFLAAAGCAIASLAFWRPALPPGFVADIPSLYARWIVWEQEGDDTGHVRHILTDYRSTDGSVVMYDPYRAVLAIYDAFMQVAAAVQPSQMLMLGGGVGSVTRRLLKQHADAYLDVVEIDPKLLGIAREHFLLTAEDEARMTTIAADARPFLNVNEKTYDIVFMDAYSSMSPPFHLATYEALRHLRRAVGSRGLMVVNMIAVLDGSARRYGAAQLATLRAVFPYVRCARVNHDEAARKFNQNFVVLCAHSADVIDPVFKANGWITLPDAVFGPGGFVLYDDYAPIEMLGKDSDHHRDD